MRKLLILAFALFSLAFATAFSEIPPHSDWKIGPIIQGKNYSVGMPLEPEPMQEGWSFDFPYPDHSAGHVHYVTFDPGPLSEKSRVVVRYQIRAREGTRFVPQEDQQLPGTVSLFFQREGDDWSAKGRYNFYRWYAPSHSVREIAPGTHEMIVRFDDPSWTAVMGGRSQDNSRAFREAIDRTSSIGLVFGSTSARGHGVYSTAPARFELLAFELR